MLRNATFGKTKIFYVSTKTCLYSFIWSSHINFQLAKNTFGALPFGALPYVSKSKASLESPPTPLLDSHTTFKTNPSSKPPQTLSINMQQAQFSLN